VRGGGGVVDFDDPNARAFMSGSAGEYHRMPDRALGLMIPRYDVSWLQIGDFGDAPPAWLRMLLEAGEETLIAGRAREVSFADPAGRHD
jgi:hypothetical protein